MTSEKRSPRQVLFVLTIDTEEEWDWHAGFPVPTYSVENTQKIPKFQSFCRKIGIKPTYFIDYTIASDPGSVAQFISPLKEGRCEIGAHLHPWGTPPIEEEICENTTHAVNLPIELVRRKLQNLTHKLADEFGERPQTFRSGRWGMNGSMLKLLHEEGYQTDSSVHPFYSDSTFSYDTAPDIPYWPDWNDCTRSGSQREIFEIPVTSGFSRPQFAFCHRIHRMLSAAPWNSLRGIGILWHLKILRKLQLSPELADASNMIALVKACVNRGHRIIHMFFHSSSLLQGGSPYVVNDDDEEAFYRNIADVITYLTTHVDVKFCTLTEARQDYLQEDHA